MKKNKMVSAVAVGLMLTGQAWAGDITLRYAHWLPEQHPMAQYSIPEWTKSITEASGGSIKFEIYPAQQLGAAKDHYDMVRDGVADISWVNPGYQPGRFPVLGAVEIPFLIGKGTGANKAIDEWYSRYAEREMKDVKVCLTHLGTIPATLHSKSKIESPDNIKGLNIRTPNATVAGYIAEMGGANVQVSAPEARDALEKGSADAIFFPPGSFWLFNLDHVAKYHVDLPMYTQAANVIINKATYGKMSDEQKAVIDAHCTADWSERYSKPIMEFEQDGLERLRNDPDQIMVSVTEAQKNAWIDYSKPLHDNWSKNVSKRGYDADKVWDDLQTTLEKYSVSFE